MWEMRFAKVGRGAWRAVVNGPSDRLSRGPRLGVAVEWWFSCLGLGVDHRFRPLISPFWGGGGRDVKSGNRLPETVSGPAVDKPGALLTILKSGRPDAGTLGASAGDAAETSTYTNAAPNGRRPLGAGNRQRHTGRIAYNAIRTRTPSSRHPFSGAGALRPPPLSRPPRAAARTAHPATPPHRPGGPAL